VTVQRVPLFLATCGVAGGTAAGYAAPALATVVLGVAGTTGLAARRAPAGRVLALACVPAFVACALVVWRTPAPLLAQIARDVPRCSISGTVAEHLGGLGSLVEVDGLACDDRTFTGRLGAAVMDAVPADVGSRATGDALIVPLGRAGFDATRRRAGASVQLEGATLEFAPPDGVLGAAASIRGALRAASANLPPAEGALLRGLTIGDTSGLSEDDIDLFRRSGLSHLVAVSGANVAIVVTALMFLVGRGGLYARTGTAVVGISMFVLVTGPEPSVLRAAAMGAVAVVATLRGRSTDPVAILMSAIAIVLLMKPSLVTSLGLALSAAATAGIVLWTGPISGVLSWLPRPVRLALAATVAAQLAVAPLLALFFGQLSLVAPLANLAAVAAVAPPTVLGVAAGTLGTVAEPVAAFLARAAAPFCAWILFVARQAGELGWAAVEVPGWTGAVAGAAALVCGVRTARTVRLPS